MARGNYGRTSYANEWATPNRPRQRQQQQRPYIVCQHCHQGWRWANAHKTTHCFNCSKTFPADPSIPRQVHVTSDAPGSVDSASVVSAVLHQLSQNPRLFHVAEAVRSAAATNPEPAPAQLSSKQIWDASGKRMSAAATAVKKCEDKASKLASQISAANAKLEALLEQQKENDTELSKQRVAHDKCMSDHRQLTVPHGEAPTNSDAPPSSDDMAVELDEAALDAILNPANDSSELFSTENKAKRLDQLRQIFAAAAEDKSKRHRKAEDRPSSVHEAEQVSGAAASAAAAVAKDAARGANAAGGADSGDRSARSRSPPPARG